MARSVVETIDKVIVELPPADYMPLRASLEKLKQDANFRSPESQYVTWKEFSDLLQEHLPDPEDANAPPWVLKIKAIMLGEDVLNN